MSCGSAPDVARALPVDRDAQGLLLIAHGYGNNPTHWPARLIERIAADGRGEPWTLYAHDWEAVANRPVVAARRGYAIGEGLAASLVGAGDPYPMIQLVGQSLGAHLVQGFIDRYRAGGGAAVVHATFLEPFLVRGAWRWRWGEAIFGRGADFAESYVVRHDPALGTNRYLRRAHNFDISAVVPEEAGDAFVGRHWWVVEYYRQSVGRAGPGFELSPIASAGRFAAADLTSAFPPGEVTSVVNDADGNPAIGHDPGG